MARTNLSLGRLGHAVGVNANNTSETKLSQDCRGNTNSGEGSPVYGQAAMMDFAIDSISSLSFGSTWYVWENSSGTCTLNFGSAGSLFLSRIANNTDNFYWDEDGSNQSKWAFNPNQQGWGKHDYTAPFTTGNISSGGPFQLTCRVYYLDNYNIKATGYNAYTSDTVQMYNSSDRRLKHNINLIGTSPYMGLNIYSFEYLNPMHGVGAFQGVMSDEIPQDAVITIDGYDRVNYNMLDVEFKRI